MSHHKNIYSRLIFWLVLGVFLSYVGSLLFDSLKAQLGENWENLGGFFRFLLSYVLLIAGILVLGWLNYRGPFHWWFLQAEKKWWYWTWTIGLTWLMFELLQLRQGHEVEFVDENALVTLLLMVLIIGIGYVADAFRVRREQLVLQQQKTEAELWALKSQINPHFLFNILNTIYNEAAAADNEHVADLVQQLAGIMRFTLQESAKPFTSMENELAFLDKYLNLQRARLPQRENIRLDIHIDYDGQPAQIAPLLLIPFIENAFQYGISVEHPCVVKIELSIDNQTLTLQTQNRIFPKPNHKKGHGVGIANVEKRLKLIYPNRHQLVLKEENKVFKVNLQIKLS
jgi:hypothetical protein